jgi:hypothetical protein
VYFESHAVAVREFGDRMTVPLRIQAAVKTEQEESTKISLPYVLRLTAQEWKTQQKLCCNLQLFKVEVEVTAKWSNLIFSMPTTFEEPTV